MFFEKLPKNFIIIVYNFRNFFKISVKLDKCVIS